jgi:hypothetical protein
MLANTVASAIIRQVTSSIKIYALFGCLFIMFADKTFRSMQGPVTSDLNSPLYLRGVHLGLNLAGMFLMMPLFQFIGIPLVLHKLRKIRSHSSALFASSNVFGILSFITLVIIVLLLLIAGSLPDPTTVWNRAHPELRYFEDCRVVKRPTTTSTTMSELSTVATLVSDAWTGWGTLEPEETQYCRYYSRPAIEDQEFGVERDRHVSVLERDVGAITTLIVVSVFHWIFSLVFIGVADALILKAIGEPNGSVAQTPAHLHGGVVLVHPCPNCEAPLQFVRTGPTTQVQCYKCSSVCEFQSV